MIWSWFKRRRRRKIAARPFPAEWSRALKRNFEHWSLLTKEEQARLREIIQVLVEEKYWEGCGGLELTDEVIVTVAAQAALLLLEIEHDYYRNVLSVLIYPEGYLVPRSEVGEGGWVVAEGHLPVQGTAHQRGPVILSWTSALQGGKNARDGRNVVFHEFAHKLDMLDGLVDGTPPIDCSDELDRWVQSMTPAFESVQQRRRRRKRDVLSDYAGTDVAEFFAVATEVFFEKPAKLRERHPDVYRALRDFYRQDPAERLSR
ncbi:MAG: zinc-dependent peptidase [Deltaproteobacteria bacterium]|nr:zinc-dependent peptidase [Deltaproteobacteria bacterium]MBW2534149.1 zinc-dependent peptidase [Deltaproteobacteria bacterium]